MFDIIGAVTLTLGAVALVGILIAVGAPDRATRLRMALGATIWFALVVSLGAMGVFSLPAPLGTAAIGAAVMGPFVAGLVALARSRSARAFALGVPVAVLVAVNAGRLAGAFFVALYAAGRLPPTFALSAGWGDIAIGAAAIPLAWAIYRGLPGWRALALVWNTLGIADLVNAVTLGIGSAPDSPLRFMFEHPDSRAVTMLPWVMIPGFLVPIYALVHVALFARLAASAANLHKVPLEGAA